MGDGRLLAYTGQTPAAVAGCATNRLASIAQANGWTDETLRTWDDDAWRRPPSRRRKVKDRSQKSHHHYDEVLGLKPKRAEGADGSANDDSTVMRVDDVKGRTEGDEASGERKE